MFPHGPYLSIGTGQGHTLSIGTGQGHTTVHYQEIIETLGPLLTSERKNKIAQVVKERTYSVSVVVENLHDRGNISAVMRSAEAFGLVDFHIIQDPSKESFKESQRTTAGADKWLEISKWRSASDCIIDLKLKGKRIIATHLSPQSLPIHEVSFSDDCAIILGNEKEGISQEMITLADHFIQLPMVGFVQSYNISVAAALSFYYIYQQRQTKRGVSGDLTEEQQGILTALYYLKTYPSFSKKVSFYEKTKNEKTE